MIQSSLLGRFINFIARMPILLATVLQWLPASKEFLGRLQDANPKDDKDPPTHMF